MERKVKEFVTWYRGERGEFCREVYIDKSSWLKKYLMPYSDWDSEMVFEKESEFVMSALDKLKEKNFDKKSTSLAALTLSNRVEYLSDHSDFYVTFAGLMVVLLTVIGIPLPILLKLALALLVLSGVLFSVCQRIKLRAEVAVCKEIVNIFKQFESKHSA